MTMMMTMMLSLRLYRNYDDDLVVVNIKAAWLIIIHQSFTLANEVGIQQGT